MTKEFFTETGSLGSPFEPDPAFARQAGAPSAPTCHTSMPHLSAETLRTQLQLHAESERELARTMEDLAYRSAPGSAVSAALTYGWRG